MKLRGILLASVITIAITSCTAPPKNKTQSLLSKYHAAGNVDRTGFSMTGIRYQGLRDAALSLGARGGLAWRSKIINQIVARHERQLDLIYQFQGLMLDQNVLPPVLIEGRQTLEQTADDVIRVSDRAYTIQAQARFVSMPPSWREYLKLHYRDPEVPDASLLPRTNAEKEVWDRYLDEGWQMGITQADVIFSENLGRLKRDFQGMVRYRTLLAQNMVSLPYVAQINLGVTTGDSQMAVNDRILRITALPEFNVATNEWNPEITPDKK
jgi:defect-in-organelle-trafficking protein DotC